MIRCAKTTVIAFLAVAVGNASAGAQKAANDSTSPVPRDLVNALIGFGRGPNQPPPQIFIGKLPDGFPRELLPPSSKIVGGVRFPDSHREPDSAGAAPVVVHRTAIVVIPAEPDSAFLTMSQTWERAGWRSPKPSIPTGGFTSSPIPSGNAYLCTDSSTFNATTFARPGGGKYLRLDLTTGERSNACTYRGSGALSELRDSEMRFPTLLAPAGAAVRMSSAGGAPNARSISADLQTELSAAQIIEAYGTQLKKLGWTLEGPLSTSGAVFQIGEMKDEKGRPLIGVLSAVAFPRPKWLHVAFQIFTAESLRAYEQ